MSVVVEKGSVVGAHILSGAVVAPVSLDRLIPDWREDPDGPLKTAVARDEFLDGSAFNSSPSVGHRALVGEAEAGAAIMLAGVRVTYVQVFQSPEFKRQRAGVFNFGSLSASVRF